MRYILNLANRVIAHVQRSQLGLKSTSSFGASQTRRDWLHIRLEPFYLGETVVTDIQLLEIDERFQALYPSDPIGLEGQDP